MIYIYIKKKLSDLWFNIHGIFQICEEFIIEYLPVILISTTLGTLLFYLYICFPTSEDNLKMNIIEDKVITILKENTNNIELNETEEYINIRIKK